MTDNKALYETLNDEQKAVQIPYYLHEGEMTRLERLNKRCFIAFLVVLVMLFVTNAGWIVYEMQYETFYVEQDVDTGAGAAVLNGTGRMIYYGEGSPSDAGESEAGEQEQPDEAVPDM